MLTRKRAAELTMGMDASSYPSKKEGESSARLFDLPQEIFHKIVGEYLYLFELVAFDNSVCNKADRIKYLALLANVTIKQYFYIRSPLQLKWVYWRKLRLQVVEMSSRVNDHILCFREISWPSIKEWRIIKGPSVNPDIVVECLRQCTSLETLTLAHNDYYYEDNEEKGEHYEFSKFNTNYANEILRIFDDPEFCNHLRCVNFVRSKALTDRVSLYSGSSAVIAVTKHCRNLTSVEFGTIAVSAQLMMEFFRVCGATLEALSPDIIGANVQDLFTKYRLPDVFQYCPRLKSITLNSQSNTNAALIEIGHHCPDLVELSIDCPDSSFTDDALVVLFESCRKLTGLRLMGPTEKNIACSITDRAIIRASECCPNLTSVSLLFLPNLTVKSLESLARNCPQIQKLFFTFLAISKEALQEFGIQFSFPSLREFSSCYNQVCDRFLLELVQKSPLLTLIRMNQKPEAARIITNTGMRHIATHCRNLTSLELSGLYGVTSGAPLVNIVRNNPNITKSRFHVEARSIHFSMSPTLSASHVRKVERYIMELEALLNSRG